MASYAARLRRAAEKEDTRRARRAPQAATVDFDKAFHPKQARLVRAVTERRIRFIEANCGRQAGKSHGLGGATDLVASSTPSVNTLYVTKTFASCEKMAFKPAVKLGNEWRLGGRPRAGNSLDITYPNGSTSYFMGADTEGTIEKLRGTPNLALVVIDEAGLYDPDDLKLMIEAVTPGLRPLAGTLVIAGTPSRAGKQGTWWGITQNPHYDHHYFDYRDNDRVPSFADVERLIDEELATMFPDLSPAERRETAYFKREYLAQFEVDLAEKVYQLTEKNLVDVIPEQDSHATGGDIGVSANDALVCLGWTDGAHDIFVTDQEEASGQDSIACADMVNAHNEKRHPLFIALDPGGLGQKTIKTAQRLYPEVPVVDADKPPIGLQVRAVNFLLQGGAGWCLRIKRGSKLALELAGPTWVDGLIGGKIDEHGQHSDLVPSLRYAAIKARPYLPDREAVEDDATREARILAEAHAARIALAKKKAKANAKPTAEDRFEDGADEDTSWLDDGDDVDLD